MGSTLTLCGNGCGRFVRSAWQEAPNPEEIPWCQFCLAGDPAADPLPDFWGEGGAAGLLAETGGDLEQAVTRATQHYRREGDRPTEEKLARFDARLRTILTEAVAPTPAPAPAEAAATRTASASATTTAKLSGR